MRMSLVMAIQGTCINQLVNTCQPLPLHHEGKQSSNQHMSQESFKPKSFGSAMLFVFGTTVTHSFCMQDYSTVGIPDYIAPEVMLKEGLWDGM